MIVVLIAVNLRTLFCGDGIGKVHRFLKSGKELVAGARNIKKRDFQGVELLSAMGNFETLELI